MRPTLLLSIIALCGLFGSPATVRAAAKQAQKVAVLELRSSAQIDDREAAYLGDVVRAGALTLPRTRWFVLTRENVVESLPPGTDLSTCIGACEVETGRKIGADWVVSGEIVAYGTQLKLTLKLHNTASGSLTDLQRASAASVDALETEVERAARRLFASLAPPALAPAAAQAGPTPTHPVDACTAFEVDPCARQCDRGDGRSCSALAFMYEMGEGVGQSADKARALYERACQLGTTVACTHRARLSAQRPARIDAAAASTALDDLCRQGDGRACARLGHQFETGQGAVRDHHIAALHYRRGCRAGFGVACSHLRRVSRLR